MKADILFLLLAIALLWFPRQSLRLGSIFKRKRRSDAERATGDEPWRTREPGDPRVRMGEEFSKFRNYVDALRAGVASVALAGGWGIPPVLWVAEGASRNAGWSVIIIRSLILIVGLLVQTVRYERRKFTFFPPIFFIAGLSLGLCEPAAALSAFALIWAMHVMFTGAMSFLATYSVLIVGFGHLFARGGDLSAVLAGILCFTPVLLSLLSNRPLVTFSRKSSHSDR